MAVQAVYFSTIEGLEVALEDPENRLFASKAEADARDRELLLGEEIREFLIRKVGLEGLTEDMADACAMAISRERDLFQKALKKPELLNQLESPNSEA